MLAVIGLGDDGRSRVVEVRDLAPGVDGPHQTLWHTELVPPELPVPRRGADEPVRAAAVSPTGSRWALVRLAPGQLVELHRTDTLDYDFVVFGEVALVLQDGEILLRAGDAVVIPGLLHSWRPGPDGVLMSAVLLGLPPVS
jgi:hypothetical protein